MSRFIWAILGLALIILGGILGSWFGVLSASHYSYLISIGPHQSPIYISEGTPIDTLWVFFGGILASAGAALEIHLILPHVKKDVMNGKDELSLKHEEVLAWAGPGVWIFAIVFFSILLIFGVKIETPGGGSLAEDSYFALVGFGGGFGVAYVADNFIHKRLAILNGLEVKRQSEILDKVKSESVIVKEKVRSAENGLQKSLDDIDSNLNALDDRMKGLEKATNSSKVRHLPETYEG